MKYLVVSDTHGDIKKVIEVYKRTKDINAIIHLGDYKDDAENIEDELGCQVISVKGNCDFDYEGDFKVIDTEAGRILLTHGHAQRVKMTYMNLVYRAQELDCVAALFGHTHMPCFTEEGGVLLFNPGSLTQPADGSNGSYGILEIDEENCEVKATVIYYQKQSKAKGGHLRSLLNYSDRF